jgi:hypothetical protein
MNMKKKIEKIEEMLEKDEFSDYEFINYKIMKLMVLKQMGKGR